MIVPREEKPTHPNDDEVRSALRPWVRPMAQHLIHLAVTSLPSIGDRRSFPPRLIDPIIPALDVLIGLSCRPLEDDDDDPRSIVRSESGRVLFDLLNHEIDLIIEDADTAFKRTVNRNVPIIKSGITHASDLGMSAIDLWVTTYTSTRRGGLMPWDGDPKFGLAAAAGALPDLTPEKAHHIILGLLDAQGSNP